MALELRRAMESERTDDAMANRESCSSHDVAEVRAVAVSEHHSRLHVGVRVDRAGGTLRSQAPCQAHRPESRTVDNGMRKVQCGRAICQTVSNTVSEAPSRSSRSTLQVIGTDELSIC